jgi:hypothetical protein
MKSYILSIGCDVYLSNSLCDLNGSENDASSIFNCLVESEYSIYDKESSILLKSPTVAEVKNWLEKILLDSDTPDVFTLFFAGHGGVATGTYYICLNDTKPDRLEFSAFSLSEIFRMVSSSGVKHVNLVIDACNTGGLVNDLISIIKPDLIGAKGSFGIAILAAAALDEYASEVNGQGLLTSHLIKYINGDKRISIGPEYLDLVTIGRQISTEFINNLSKQTPSSWGINLYGPSVFSRNPFYNPNGAIGTYEFSYIPPASRLGRLIQHNKKEFWEALENLDTGEGGRMLLPLFQKLLSNTDDRNDALALIIGIGSRFTDQVAPTQDLIKLDLLNVLLTALMPYLGENNTDVLVDAIIEDFNRYGKICINDLLSKLEADNTLLIYKGGSGFDVLSNYYYLSLRIAKILGLLSQLVLVDSENLQVALCVIERIYKTYSNHLMCMSDIQAPYLYIFFKVFCGLPETIRVKEYLVKYLADYLKIRGRVSQINLQPEKVSTYLLQRYTQEKIDIEYTANPTGIGSVLLLAASHYELGDEVDKQLHLLDRVNFHLFIPSNVNEFSQNIIKNGENLVLKCGFDFWNVKKFFEICTHKIDEYAKNNYSNLDKRRMICCVASAYAQPDRIPLMII